MQETPVEISNSKLNAGSLRVSGFSNVYISNNHDSSTQLGFIAFVVDKSINLVPISFKSYKACRVVRAVLGDEQIIFGEICDLAFSMASELSRMHTGYRSFLCLLTDSKSFFEIIPKGSNTSKRRLMLDIGAVGEALRKDEIFYIGPIRSGDNNPTN